MAVRERRKLPQRAPEPVSGVRITARRPRILVVGGEAKNFKGASFGERFDCEVHMKTDGNSIHVKEDRFDAVVGLPWITPTLSRNAKVYARLHDIPVIESPKVGQIEHWLGKQFKWAQAYFDGLDKAKATPSAPTMTPEAILASSAPQEPPSAVLWDEDQLWSAYGEPFVAQLKGLDGETTDRKTFVELMEAETGLRGEPVEILIAILRRQGIICEDEGVVSIGSVNPSDVEKRKKFIERQAHVGRQPFNNGSRSIRDEVREALADGEEPNAKSPRIYHRGVTNEDLVECFKKLDLQKTYIQNSDLYLDLFQAGLSKDGKPFSMSAMQMYLLRLERGGFVSRVKTGIGHRFRIVIGRYEAPKAEPVAPVAAPAPYVPTPDVKTLHVPSGALSSQPFAAAFPAPAPVQEPSPELPFPAPPEEKDISKEGILYSMLEKTYTPARLPELGGLVPAVRAFRGLFYETAWDTAAVKGMLIRLKLPVNDPNQKRAQTRKNDFTDDEWSYFALEYLRDQTLFSMLPLIDDTNRIWRICEGCQKHFYFNVPRICYECKDDNRRIVEGAKGG